MKRSLWFALLTAMALAASSLAAVPVAADCGDEGCTPGYWKQSQHLDSWIGYDPSDDFGDVFGVGPGVGTLEDALKLKGGNGGLNQLARQGVAALLNARAASSSLAKALSTDVDYRFSEDEVIALVQEGFDSGDAGTAKDTLATENERGCPLD